MRCLAKGCPRSCGPATCRSFTCKCPLGWCAQGGRCYPKGGKCRLDTGAKCAAALGCKSGLGETNCVNGKCLCKTGHCAQSGQCYPVFTTGAGCKFKKCAGSLGPTRCVGDQCVCQHGFIVMSGKCKRARI